MAENENKNQDLQPHQLHDIYHEEDVPFNDIGQNMARKMLFYGIIIIELVMIASFFVTIPREIDLTFELRGGKMEDIIQFQEELYVKNTFIDMGDYVKVDDPLLSVTSPKIVSMISRIKEAEAELTLYDKNKVNANNQELLLVKTQLSGLNREINQKNAVLMVIEKSKAREIENLNAQLENITRQHERNSALLKSGAISQADHDTSLKRVQETKQLLITTGENYNNEIAILQGQIENIKSEIANLTQEEIKLISFNDYDRAIIENKLELLKQELELQYGKVVIVGNVITILCENEGKVTLLTDSDKEVSSDQILIRLQTDETPYYAYALSNSKDIAQLKPNSSVILKYAGLPHYYYGTMSGKIVVIGESPDANGNYPVRIKIEDKGKLETKVTKGMTGSASVIIEEKPVIEYVFKIFLDVANID